MVVTYAHTHQTTLLPRLINGTPRRYLATAIGDGDFTVPTAVAAELDFDLYAPMYACDTCPPYGAPAIACDQHGSIYSREQYDGEEGLSYYGSQSFWPSSGIYCCEYCAETYDYPLYDDFYDYYDDNFGYLDDSLEELAAVEQEIEAFVDVYLRNEAPTNLEPWQQENDRHCIAKRKRAHRAAISRSASHRRRDGSVNLRGRRGFDGRRYEAGVTPRRDYLAKKQAEF